MMKFYGFNQQKYDMFVKETECIVWPIILGPIGVYLLAYGIYAGSQGDSTNLVFLGGVLGSIGIFIGMLYIIPFYFKIKNKIRLKRLKKYPTEVVVTNDGVVYIQEASEIQYCIKNIIKVEKTVNNTVIISGEISSENGNTHTFEFMNIVAQDEEVYRVLNLLKDFHQYRFYHNASLEYVMRFEKHKMSLILESLKHSFLLLPVCFDHNGYTSSDFLFLDNNIILGHPMQDTLCLYTSLQQIEPEILEKFPFVYRQKFYYFVENLIESASDLFQDKKIGIMINPQQERIFISLNELRNLVKDGK